MKKNWRRPDIVDTWNNLSWQKSEIFVAKGFFFSSKPAYIWSSHSWCVNQTYPTSANWTINPRAIYLSSYDSEAICFCLSVHSGCVSSEEDKGLRENFYPLFFCSCLTFLFYITSLSSPVKAALWSVELELAFFIFPLCYVPLSSYWLW